MVAVSKFIDKCMNLYVKHFGNGLTYTRKIAGVPVTTNIKTGTKVAKNAYGEGTKLIQLGEGNRVFQKTGLRTIIVDNTYPTGDAKIFLPNYQRDWVLTPKQFAEFCNDKNRHLGWGRVNEDQFQLRIGKNAYRAYTKPHPKTGPDHVYREECYIWGKPVSSMDVSYPYNGFSNHWNFRPDRPPLGY